MLGCITKSFLIFLFFSNYTNCPCTNNITFKEFLELDKTNEKEYNYTYYDCTNFSTDLKLNASHFNFNLTKINLYYNYKKDGHQILQYNNIYIEPQTDQIYNESELFFHYNYSYKKEINL